jgi:hypothetical protein
MKTRLGAALAAATSLALAQAPAPAQKEPKPEPPKAQKAQKTQSARRGQPAGKAHAKPTPEQIRKFNELQKQEKKP